MKNKLLNSVLITLIFLGMYVGIRALPSSDCGFLHYEVLEITEDGIELCATSHPGFLDFTRLSYPISVKIHSDGDIIAGQKNRLTLRVSDPRGRPLYPHDLAITHTERIHLMVIDPELGDYHHLHPRADGFSSEYLVDWTPAHAGNYRFYAEMVPLQTRRQVVGNGELQVKAAGEKGIPLIARVPDFLDINVEYDAPRVRRDVPVRVSIQRNDGGVLALENIMGDFAHMVGFDQEGRGFIHMHTIPTGREKNATAELEFLFHGGERGKYRLWLQIKVDGEEVFFPYDLWIS